MSEIVWTALDDLDGELDTSDQIQMFECMQKVFIVNGENLKVADFRNVKITTGALPTFTDDDSVEHDVYPTYGSKLTGVTSGATGIVDYITSTNGACTIYCYHDPDADSFVDTETVFGTSTYDVLGTATAGTAASLTDSSLEDDYVDDYFNGWVIEILSGTGAGEWAVVTDYTGATGKFDFTALSGGSTPDTTSVYSVHVLRFTLTADEESGPHGYDWTVYGNDEDTYGEMPDKAYLGCMYRARAVVAGNPEYPYQIWMSRVGAPFDFLYEPGNALSPYMLGNGRAGEVGDIIRALIPVQDEYLIIGAASSIWVIRGDPAEGGGMACLNNGVGVFGYRSWCFDDAMNLYFASKTGIYRIPYGIGPAESLSRFALPNLVEDTELDPTVHRVSMGYDAERKGILITILEMTTGANVCYWYDLATEGFYPEDYPTSCGPACLHFYPSNDDSTRKLLIGCMDGYVRNFSRTAKDDQTTSGTEAIDSEVLLPIIQPGDDGHWVRLSDIQLSLSGGEAGGGMTDSDAVDVEVYRGDDAEAVVEAVEDGDTPLGSKTITGAGRATRVRNRARGRSLGIRLHNDTADSSWSIEKISAGIEEVG